MKPSSELAVQPVRRYRTPKYPSHLDPDPTQHPNPIPYPISGKAVSALASASFLLSNACHPPDQPPASRSRDVLDNLATTDSINSVDDFSLGSKTLIESHQPDLNHESDAVLNFNQRLQRYERELDVDHKKEHDQVIELAFSGGDVQMPREIRKAALRKMLIEEASGNPLCVAVSGLPHQTSAFGTGIPDRVEGDAARKIIERVFSEAGYNLIPEVCYAKDGIAFVVDGYDIGKKVGFVVGDWENLDNDAIVSWSRTPRRDHGKDPSFEIQALAAMASRKIMLSNDLEKQKQIADIEAAKRLADPAKAVAALNAILDRISKKYLSLNEIRVLEQKAEQGKEFIAVISTFDDRFQIPWNYQVPQAEVATISQQLVKKMKELQDAGEDVNSEENSAQLRKWRTKKLAELKAKSVMQGLEKTAREYIEWAKTQGLE